MTNAAVNTGIVERADRPRQREEAGGAPGVATRGPTFRTRQRDQLSRTRGATEKRVMRMRSRMAACWTLLIPACAGIMLVSVIPACGDSGQASMSPYRELVKVMFTSGLFDVGLSRASKADTGALRAQLEQHLGRPLTDDETGRLQRMVTRVLLEVFPQSFWEDTYVDMLSKHVSVKDARELLAFYGTPLGQKTLRLAAMLTAEADEASQRVLKARENEFRQRFGAEFQREFPELNAGMLAQPGQPVPSPSSASSFWYYCADLKMYYPYVRQCTTGWLKVVPKTGTPRQ
jgi:hypothetical protein